MSRVTTSAAAFPSTFDARVAQLRACENAEVRRINRFHSEIQARVTVPHSVWGLPLDVYTFLDSHDDVQLIDLRDIRSTEVTLIFEIVSGGAR